MRKLVLGLGGLAVIGGTLGAWWWTRITPPVTEAEARAYLDRIVDAAAARDFDQVCRLNGSANNCHAILREFSLQAAVPTDPPRVVATRYHQKGGGGTAGRVLIVEGTTSCGTPYSTEVFVFRENRFHFKAINAVYWSNARFAGDGSTSPTGDPPPSC